MLKFLRRDQDFQKIYLEGYYIKNFSGIIPGSFLHVIVSFITDISYIISFFLVSLVISSRLVMFNQIYSVEVFIDLVMAIDMILRFFTAFENDFEYVTDLKIIAIHYLSNRFIFDLIGTVPWLLTLELYPNLYYFKIFRYFQIERFFDQIQNLSHKISESTEMWSKTAAK